MSNPLRSSKNITILLGCFLAAWNPLQAQHNLQKPPIVGLSTPFQLQPGNDTLHVRDYFLEPSAVTAVKAPEGLTVNLTDSSRLAVIKGDLTLSIADLAFHIENKAYHIPLLQSKKRAVSIFFKPEETYDKVLLKGEMNNWTPSRSPMKLNDGRWSIEMQLQPGVYEYLFVADGKELLDPGNDDIVPNGMGGKNSVLTISGPPENELPAVYTRTYFGQSIKLHAQNTNNILAYWQNTKIEALAKDGLIEVEIPEQAGELQRSFIRAWAYNNQGYSNDLLIPLEKGQVIDTAEQLSPNDWERTAMYFMMVDRFKNGTTDNDEPVDNAEILPKANYYGGDLAGITQKIEDGYFDSLGVNVLWLSPITQNPKGAYGQFPDPETKFSGYHGYWPVSSTSVDYRFGTETELRNLLRAAHDHGMNVILDYVANHVHELHWVYQNHPEWATDLYLPDGTENTQNWDSHRLTTWFDTFMPTLDFSRPEVVEAMTDSALFWLQNYPMDGFRHDATKHIQLDFWRTLTHKIKSQVAVPRNKRIYQIGETYGSRSLIASYINTGMLDGQFDFNLYDDAVAVFAMDDQPMTRLSRSLQESFQYYGYHNLMGYITGNQDRARFISYAGGDLSFEEDAKVAGWKRDIGVGDPEGYKKLGMLLAFNMTIPGIPVIYYGDEIGMPGGNDPDNRRMMRFDDLKPEERSMRDTTSRLAHIRTSRLSLMYGDFHPLHVDMSQYAYARNYFEEWTFVFFNKDESEQKVRVEMPAGFTAAASLKAQFGNAWKKTGNVIEVMLPPHSFEILTTPKLDEE